LHPVATVKSKQIPNARDMWQLQFKLRSRSSSPILEVLSREARNRHSETYQKDPDHRERAHYIHDAWTRLASSTAICAVIPHG